MPDRKILRDELAKLNGWPPHDEPSNICRGDAYYGKSLEEKYGKTIAELERFLFRGRY
jgi:hypothetical protein